tara:strand:- start:37092 stop:37703 length:612 start_codon:yes stop_codon:yes gene_type:complete
VASPGSVKFDGQIRAAVQELKGLNVKAIRPAAVQALNRVATTAVGRTVKAVSTQTQVQPKVIKKRAYAKKANTRSLQSLVRFYAREINYGALLTPAQSRKLVAESGPKFTKTGKRRKGKGFITVGSGAYKQRVERGFVVQGKKKPTVLQRKGSARLPLNAPSFRIYKDAVRLTPKVVFETVNDRLNKEFVAAINNKLQRALNR